MLVAMNLRPPSRCALASVAIAPALALTLLGATAAGGQERARIDSAMRRTPVGALVPLSGTPSERLRFHIQLGMHDFGPSGAPVLGVSMESSNVGLTVVRAISEGERTLVTAGSLRIGGNNRAQADSIGDRVVAGLETEVGFGRHGERHFGTLAFRLPIVIRKVPAAGQFSAPRLSAFVAPTVAWGRLGLRECDDLGPGDNCGDLGIQLVFGTTRWLLAGGVRAELPAQGIAVSAGVQQMLALGDRPRLAVGLALGR